MSQVALLSLPSTVVTVIVAEPRAFAVTKPVLLTVAIEVLLELHVTAGLVVLLGDTVAESCRVLSTTMLAVVLFKLTPVASCGVTVTAQVALLLLPSAVVTVIVAEPTALAVTKPVLLTVAIDVLLELHVTAGLVVLLGDTVAVNCNVLSTTMLAVVLFKLTPVASCGVTVTAQVALLLLPSAVVTVMVAVPTALAVTKPLLLTVAIEVLLDFHVTAGFVVLLGVTVAVSCSVLSTTMLADVLFRLTPVASCGVTVT